MAVAVPPFIEEFIKAHHEGRASCGRDIDNTPLVVEDIGQSDLYTCVRIDFEQGNGRVARHTANHRANQQLRQRVAPH